MDEIRKIEKEMINTPYGLNMDETFKRLKYVRYADDFLLELLARLSSSKVQIKANIAQYMSEQLNQVVRRRKR